MTNRRRSGKGKTSVAKKSESPDKGTRKINRRSRRSKKSESPERPEETVSDYSGEELEDGKKVGKDEVSQENENLKDTTQLESGKNNDDTKSQIKEDESGGSDGSWKVKSENGGGGGIPKLKLCLTRPPEMSSPTSTSDQNPSPRRKRKSGRGNITPTKEEDSVEESFVEESSKRVTRNQKLKETQEQEGTNDVKHDEENADVETEMKEEIQPTNVVSNEEDETRIAVESICNVEQADETQSNEVECAQEESQQIKSQPEKNIEDLTEKNLVTAVDEIPVPVTDGNKDEEESEKSEINELQCTTKEEQVEARNLAVDAVQETLVVQPDPEREQEPESEPEADSEAKLEETKEISLEKRRSSSRDSSEERAKEAALRSRNKNKKKEGSEEGEVVESPSGEINRNLAYYDKNKTLDSNKSDISKKEQMENLDERIPAKSAARKRRWGSSTIKTSKKPSVSISTDVLKEIIPEVKPLLMSEVQLSPNEEDEDGQLKDSEENLQVSAKKVEREKIIQSSESEKDYEEEAVESGVDEPTPIEATKPTTQAKEKEFTTFTRKVSVMSSNEKLQKSPSPPRHKPSNILYIVNLVRPFTIPQLKELLARTGTITEDGFWIDKIKSKCYIKYETEEEAKITRHALHGVRWPVSNPKQLNVDFGTEAAMKAAMEGNEITTKRPIPSLFDKQIELKTSEKTRDREKDKSGDRRDRSEKDKKERGKQRDEDKRDEGEEEKDKKSRPPVEPLVRDRPVRRVTMPIREWDVGKNEDGFSPPPDVLEFSRHRDDRYERRVEYDRDKRDEYDDRRRRDKDRSRRSTSIEPPRKSKKKSEEETPAKLLDDLFRKTKTTPCIYWLPLTPEQISVKEEMRRKHMAEHEKKVAELRKIQREQSKRNSDKRRRRTRSRSRSRSTKK